MVEEKCDNTMTAENTEPSPCKQSDYQIVHRDGPDRVTLHFGGMFQGKAVEWEASFLTLAREARECAPGQTLRLRNFIEIEAEECAPGRRRLRVGLHLAAMDGPAILKTLTMVRQYRRLRPGRHEFGPEHTFPAGAG